jgi:rod shape determining protein RodA
MLQQRVSVWRYFDLWLLAAVLLLTAYGIVMIRSAISGADEFLGYEVRQVQFAALGLVALFVVAAIDYRILTSGHWYIYAGFLGLLLIVAAIGTLGNEARRWISIGGFNLQPTELGRIFFAITFAQFLAQRQPFMTRFSNTILSGVYLAVPIVLIFLQPDLGMSILFSFMWLIMLIMAGLPLAHFVILGISGAVGLGAVLPYLQPYQRARLLIFFDPTANPDQQFNIDQALISIGSGSWFGKGYFQGTQSQLGFLRVQHTDFIFSMLTEEMGFIFGSLFVIGLIGFILVRILRAASLTPDPAGKLICVGIAAFLFFQTVVSVGMNVRLVPVTGLTLPFVSYGGSSLVTLFFGIGVVESIVMRHRKQEFG